MTYRALFCGGREWSAAASIMVKMSAVRDKHPDVVIVHGAGRGADQVAHACAEMLGVPVEAFPADWDNRPKHLAGPERNQRMLDSGVDAVYAFKQGFDRTMSRGGTEDMVRRATAAGVPCQVIERPFSDPSSAAIHSATGRNQDGMSTKCGLTSQHHSTCSGFQSAVTCEECRQMMEAQ